MRFTALALVALPLMAASISCVRREIQVHTDPPGALVYLNNVEIGRSPVTRPFTFYGTYDVVIRMEGYETLKTKKLVLAPWWQWVPIDLAAEALPLTDRQKITFKLSPTTQPDLSPEEMLRRATEMETQLPALRNPTTVPTTQP